MTPGLTGNTMFTPMLYPAGSTPSYVDKTGSGTKPVESHSALPTESVSFSTASTAAAPVTAAPAELEAASPAPNSTPPGTPGAAYAGPYGGPYGGGFSPGLWTPGSGNFLSNGALFSPTAPLADFGSTFETPGADAGGGGMEAMLAAALQQQQMIQMQMRMMEPTADQAAIASRQEIDSRPIDYVNGKNPNARVVVLDGFKPGKDGKLNHGEAVIEVLKRSGNLADDEIQKIDDGARSTANPFRLLLSPGMDSPQKRLDTAIELLTVESLRRTSIVLESIADDPNSKVETINQSQGIDGFGTYEALFSGSIDFTDSGPVLTEKGQHVFAGVGLPPQTDQATMRQFVQRLAGKIEQLASHSPAILAERERHAAVSKRLGEQGVAYVVSAGNAHEDVAQYEGFLPASFEHNMLSNPYNVVVGATDTKGTEDRADDTLAGFSSHDPEVDFLAVGVNVPVSQNGGTLVDGTSFSSPYVAGKLSLLSKQHPDATATQLQALLREQAGTGIAGSSIPVIE